MKRTIGTCGFAAAVLVSGLASAAVVSFSENASDPALGGLGAGGYVDIFVTPEGGDYLNHDMIVVPRLGQVLDPDQSRDLANGGTAGRVDTWANTPFSSLGAGSPTFVFTSYDPGAPPFQMADPLPEAGTSVSELNWSVFDTNTGDNAGNAPAGGYHLGRVLYSAGGGGEITILAFDDGNVQDGGQSFAYSYGIPEPGTMLLAGIGALGLVALRRYR